MDMSRCNTGKRKNSRSIGGRSLQAKVHAFGGENGHALEINSDADTHQDGSGLYGPRRKSKYSSVSRRTNRLRTESSISGNNRSVSKSAASYVSRFTRGSSRYMQPELNSAAAVHIVCAISENLARETCVASMDAGSPVSMHVTKQSNGQTYAETMAYLEMLKPDEVLLNEGRRHSQLARKVMDLFDVSADSIDRSLVPVEQQQQQQQQRKLDNDIDGTESRYGPLDATTVVKFVSRACYDQTKGAELLLRVAREETYDATMVEEYTLLSSAHALLHYVQQCLGATFLKNSIHLGINSGGNNRMTIDRSTMLQLELLVNAKTGKVKDSLIGTLDCTKTTVGSRLLRSNLMSPPARVDTINTRLELVDLFLSNAEFFYAVLEHLSRLPDVDKMLTNIILVPRKSRSKASDVDNSFVNERTASKGISALVYIKSTLQALPSFGVTLQDHLKAIQTSRQQDGAGNEDVTVVTDRSSLLVGLGGGASQMHHYRHQLLHAIIFAMTQPGLSTVLRAVSDTFTETTMFSRNNIAMRHQECFALKCEEDGMMSVLRKAFLANVDDIYKKADEYAEVHGLSVSVRYSTSRGYYLAIPADIGTDLPTVFLQPTKSGRFINCTTEEICSLNNRAQDNVHDLLLMTHDRIQEVMSVAREHYDVIATLCDSVALLDMCHSFADTVLTHR
jgi:DNA mismatch repair protein MSH4